MSRVLARPMFKKKAPKRSSKGVGITSGLMDDVAGYAEGGEVTDDRTERERAARMMLEQNRDEGEEYQRFSEQERPRMYRPPATMGMVPPQPNPQQMQAMQMQQMAQMGMLPRFQRGGFVSSRMGPVGDTVPPFVPGEDPFAMPSSMDAPTFRVAPPPMLDGREPVAESRPYVPKTPIMRSIYGIIAPTPGGIAAVERAQEAARKEEAADLARKENPIPSIFEDVSPEDYAAAQKRQQEAIDKALGTIPPGDRAAADRDARELDRESREVQKQVTKLRRDEAPPPPPPGEKKKDNLQDIKAEREARKAELAAQAEAARKENMWLALMQAGLAIAGGRSSNAITNIGQGGQAGLASFMALEQQRRRDEDAAMRRDLGEREFRLQERRLNMQEPYYAAMTQAQAMRPILQAQNQQRMLMVAQQNAAREAERLWQNKLKSDTQLQMMDPTQRKIEEDIYIRETTKKLFQPEWARVSLGVSQSQRDSYNTPEE